MDEVEEIGKHKTPQIEFRKVDNVEKLMNEGKLGKMECEKIDKLDNQ